MTKMTKLNWRLSKLPTPEELRDLVKDKILTSEEAREILFTKEDVEERDADSLKSEIKFLREIVAKLSQDKGQTTTIIREIQAPYKQYEWYKPYWTYCTTSSDLVNGGANTTTTAYFSDGSGTYTVGSNVSGLLNAINNITDINNF